MATSTSGPINYRFIEDYSIPANRPSNPPPLMIRLFVDPKTNLLTAIDSDGNNAFAGSGGTPGGGDTQLQFNNAGAFGGIAESSYDPAGPSITIADPNLAFEVLSGPTEQNGIIVSNAGLSIQAGESGSGLQFNADSDITISSINGNFSLSTANAGIEISASGAILIGSSPENPLAFYGSSSHSQQTITGSTTTDLASLQAVVRNILTALANIGLIVDGTT